MPRVSSINSFFASLITVVLLGACAGSPEPSGGAGAHGDARSSFGNFLVVGIAGDYNSRAQFERTVVSELRHKGASASAYYSVAGGNIPVSPADLRVAVKSGDFDAVFVTRVLDAHAELKVNKSTTDTQAAPIGGRIVNLFRYEYTDYTNPATIDLKNRVELSTELYDAASEEIVWSMESSSKGETNLGLLIDKTAETIVNRLNRANLIRN